MNIDQNTNDQISIDQTVIDPKKNVSTPAPEEISETATLENEFLAFDLSEEIQKALVKLKFTKATPVQKACIPILLNEETDIVALAKTGTGKTAAFGLPLVQKLEAGGGLQGLVLCPTRELAQQVAINIKNFSEFKKLKVVTVVGGESYDKQIRALNNNPEILVSTPGRLVDLMEQKIVSLEDIRYLILDEADEMLSFGFEEALESIWRATAKTELKTWLFSATMSKLIRNLANKHLKNAKEVTLNSKDEKILVESFACVIFEEDKEDALSLLIKNEKDFYGIIFATTKKQVADLEVKLRGLGLDVDSLHGDKVQADRTRTIERMKNKRTKILVATDVAARGLDIQDLTHVVNFEIPWDVETYTHRIGRTARAGKAGTVWTMVKPKESPKLVKFERALGHPFKNLRIPLVEEVQVSQKVKWLKEISERKIKDAEVAKFDKAIAAVGNEELAQLSEEAKSWLAKAFDYFGQGEELRMKQPRSLELRMRADSGSSYDGGGDRGYSPRRGGDGGGRDRGGFRGGGRGGDRDRSSSRRGDGGGYRSDRSDRQTSQFGDSQPQDNGGHRWGFRSRTGEFDQQPSSESRPSSSYSDRGSDRSSDRGFRGGRGGGGNSSGGDRGGFRGGRTGGSANSSGGSDRSSGSGSSRRSRY